MVRIGLIAPSCTKCKKGRQVLFPSEYPDHPVHPVIFLIEGGQLLKFLGISLHSVTSSERSEQVVE